MINHFPVLMVAVPLMAAPMCLLIRQRELVRIFATVIALSLDVDVARNDRPFNG